jgi:homoserine O-acetyltransferase
MMRVSATVASAALALSLAATASAQTQWPGQREGDLVVKDFRFASGERLAELKLHYMTLGTPKRNAAGDIANAVLLLHGTSSTGKMWLAPSLANELFAAGQPLDLARTYVILPDGIGRGGSSKPSDGLRGNFPHYRYHDMIVAQHRVVTEGLGVKHLRLVVGVSMGGMHTWLWGGMYPDFMDALMPLASQPIAISGRNWINRRIAIEAIRNDPDWKEGSYTKNPTHWTATAASAPIFTDNVVHVQEIAPNREAGDALYHRLVDNARKRDTNDTLWGIEAVMDYDPTPLLPKIKAKLVAINSADDEVNPPELGATERGVKGIPGARYVLIPASSETRGHFTYMLAAMWKQHLAQVMKETGE